MRRLTDLEARTIRWLTTFNGNATAPDIEIADTVRSLISTEFAAVCLTAQGRQALAEYDRESADPHGKRLLRGMSSAGRAALTDPPDAGPSGGGRDA